MMGPSHAACGATAWVALTADYTVHLADVSVPVGFGVLPVGDVGVMTGALICAGAALLPDIDHPSGTVARSLPPFSRWLARGVASVSGGHRRGTHSVVGLVAFMALAWLSQVVAVPVGDAVRWVASHAGSASEHGARVDSAAGATGGGTEAGGAASAAAGVLPGEVWPLAAVMSVLLIAFAVKVLAFVPDRLSHANWAVGLGLGAVVAAHPPEHTWWFVIAVGLGCAVHVLGDMLTTQGVHLLWPLKPRLPLPRTIYRRRSFLRVPVLGNAGSEREIALMVPLTLYALAGLACALAAAGGLRLSL